jgi:hypothetical protein
VPLSAALAGSSAGTALILCVEGWCEHHTSRQVDTEWLRCPHAESMRRLSMGNWCCGWCCAKSSNGWAPTGRGHRHCAAACATRRRELHGSTRLLALIRQHGRKRKPGRRHGCCNHAPWYCSLVVTTASDSRNTQLPHFWLSLWTAMTNALYISFKVKSAQYCRKGIAQRTEVTQSRRCRPPLHAR